MLCRPSLGKIVVRKPVSLVKLVGLATLRLEQQLPSVPTSQRMRAFTIPSLLNVPLDGTAGLAGDPQFCSVLGLI